MAVDAKKAGELRGDAADPQLEAGVDVERQVRDAGLPRYPQLGFQRPQERGRQTLAVMLEGSFTSAFSDRESPLAGTGQQGQPGASAQQGQQAQGQGQQAQQGSQSGGKPSRRSPR
ncbi:MAG: hypothetical protein U5K43_06655 [Halofilum sp. (in: g-proteobacteria)]|nr:hypothetical protein [Halofilum sp. (in: g-proteobacteria)]